MIPIRCDNKYNIPFTHTNTPSKILRWRYLNTLEWVLSNDIIVWNETITLEKQQTQASKEKKNSKQENSRYYNKTKISIVVYSTYVRLVDIYTIRVVYGRKKNITLGTKASLVTIISINLWDKLPTTDVRETNGSSHRCPSINTLYNNILDIWMVE